MEEGKEKKGGEGGKGNGKWKGNLSTLSRCINKPPILLLQAYTDCRSDRIAAIARHKSFAQITCSHYLRNKKQLMYEIWHT